MFALPKGYRVGPIERRQSKVLSNMMGTEWRVLVYYKDYPVFEIAKEIDRRCWQTRFAGRILGGDQWQQFDSMDEMLRVMCAKHRILEGANVNR